MPSRLAAVHIASLAWLLLCRHIIGRLHLHCRRGIRFGCVDRHARSRAVSAIRRRGLHDSEPVVLAARSEASSGSAERRASVGVDGALKRQARRERVCAPRQRGQERRGVNFTLHSNLAHVTAKVPPRRHQRISGCLSDVEPGASPRGARQPWRGLPPTPGLEGTTHPPHTFSTSVGRSAVGTDKHPPSAAVRGCSFSAAPDASAACSSLILVRCWCLWLLDFSCVLATFVVCRCLCTVARTFCNAAPAPILLR